MTSKRTSKVTGVALALTSMSLLVMACSPGPDIVEASNKGIVRDSAGVVIVEHAGLPTQLPVWTIPDSAEVRIGSLDGSGPEVFGRIGGLALLPNGAIVVADAQALELRAFGESGSHLWSAGRGGAGPGEFMRNITHLSRMGADSLLVSDAGDRTMVFGPDGAYARLIRLPEPTEGARRPKIIGVLDNGTLVALSSQLIVTNAIPSGVTRGQETLALLNQSGALSDGLGAFRSQESTITVTTGARGEISSVSILRLTMGRSSVFAVGATTVVAGETDRFELHRYDAAGGPTTIIRVALPVALLDDNGRRRTLALDSLAVVSDTLPAYATFRIDDAGRIWVQEFVPVYEERAANWWVLNGDGAFIARVEVPRGFDLRAFSADQVWGTRLDEFDVPYVERHRIIR